jgi:hypothetical protein
MTVQKKEKTNQSSKITTLKTEGPIGEKDEQAIIIEKTKELQKEAAEKWNNLKKKKAKK